MKFVKLFIKKKKIFFLFHRKIFYLIYIFKNFRRHSKVKRKNKRFNIEEEAK
jgi:hypothetical protein